MGKHIKKRKSINILESEPFEVKKRSRHKFWKILLVLFILIIAGAAACFAYVKNLEKKINSANGSGSLKEIEEVLSKSKGPINTLLLGNDTRGDDRGRTDTIIIMRFNPKTKKAVLISIPRDTRVKIPDHSYNKINSAYTIGGVKLMIRTIENFANIDINHYVMVDFKGFKEIVDALGGVDVYVEKSMKDSSINLNLNPGHQRLNGANALKYVRFRHDAKGDFGRIERQQKFLKAILDESIRIKSIFKLPELVNIVADNTRTNMSISEMVSLGRQFSTLEKNGLDGIMLPGTPEMRGGVSYVIPNKDEIEEIMYRVKNDLPLEGELPSGFIKNKDITLDVRNGTGITGRARELANTLKEKDFKIDNLDNADKFDYEKTLIICGSDAKNKAKKVGSYLPFADIKENNGRYDFSSDILIIVGGDYTDN
ncbi:MAG TPA: LytR family transcriptional regulator [Actinobacteria bacterium]|nr:LytR family transcriptional regulator [Actinomycetota bacterium]